MRVLLRRTRAGESGAPVVPARRLRHHCFTGEHPNGSISKMALENENRRKQEGEDRCSLSPIWCYQRVTVPRAHCPPTRGRFHPRRARTLSQERLLVLFSISLLLYYFLAGFPLPLPIRLKFFVTTRTSRTPRAPNTTHHTARWRNTPNVSSVQSECQSGKIQTSAGFQRD